MLGVLVFLFCSCMYCMYPVVVLNDAVYVV